LLVLLACQAASQASVAVLPCSYRWPPSRMFRACSRVTVDGVASGPPHMAQQPPMVE